MDTIRLRRSSSKSERDGRAVEEEEDEGKEGILVLESPWSHDVADQTSVRSFMEGWAQLVGYSLSYRMYYDNVSLSHWLALFANNRRFSVCYIAGHGNQGRLTGLNTDINLGTLFKKKSRKKPDVSQGILFGACEVGSRLEEFLESCPRSIAWVAGYTREMPWMEGMVSDLLFLHYMLTGRICRGNEGLCEDGDGEFEEQRASKAREVCEWVIEDYPMARMCGLVAFDRE